MGIIMRPYRTIIQNGETIRNFVTSDDAQTVALTVNAISWGSDYIGAQETKLLMWGPQPITLGEHPMTLIGSVSGRLDSRILCANLSPSGYPYVYFKDEKGNDLPVFATLIDLDKPCFIRVETAKYPLYQKPAPDRRWLLEVWTPKEADGTFRYNVIRLDKITADTTITLPKLTKAVFCVEYDLDVVKSALTKVVFALDWFFGKACELLGFKDYPSMAAWIVSYICQGLPWKPYSWDVKDSILKLYFEVTPEMFGLAPLVAGALTLLITGGILAFLIFVFPVVVHDVSLVMIAQADEAKAKAQATIATEHTKALETIQASTLTAEEKAKAKESITNVYLQMEKNLEPYPTPIPWTTIITIIAIIVVVGFIIAIIR